VRQNPYDNPNSLGFKFRLKRFEHVRSIIEFILSKNDTCKILDIGGSEFYWKIAQDLVDSGRLSIDLLNLNATEVKNKHFGSIVGDARKIADIDDCSYDLCHSNSVIEHVGDWLDMKAMADEVRRVAPNYFVQVPYFWFPIEPHFRVPFFHWLPEQLRYPLLMRRDLGFHLMQKDAGDAVVEIQSAKLLDRRQLTSLFPDGEIVPEKIAFMTKSLMAIRQEN
jgi:hypothetical protein